MKKGKPVIMPNASLLSRSRKVIIGTKNDAKYQDFLLYLGDHYNVEKGSNLFHIEVPEGMRSLEENAIKKARAWAEMTGEISIADDTGFFIQALHGEPGVAARRWGGELPEAATNEEFWTLLQSKTDGLEDTSAYVEQCVAVVAPNGKVRIIHNKAHGHLDKEMLKRPYNGAGYPLAAAFVANGRVKPWDEMTDQEKKSFDAEFIADLTSALHEIAQ